MDVLYKIWRVLFAIIKVAAGAAATVLLIVAVAGFVFAGMLGDFLQDEILPNAVVPPRPLGGRGQKPCPVFPRACKHIRRLGNLPSVSICKGGSSAFARVCSVVSDSVTPQAEVHQACRSMGFSRLSYSHCHC